VPVLQPIERVSGLKLLVRGVGNHLSRWGFTPQKPIQKACKQRPDAVLAWPDNQYPEIESRARAEGAEIHRGDKTALVNIDVRGRCHARPARRRWGMSSAGHAGSGR
jgi:hypothetical protein